MPNPPQADTGWLPNCATALRLAQLGAERPLAWRERLALRYHGRLCPFCTCQEDRFRKARAAMTRAEAERRKPT